MSRKCQLTGRGPQVGCNVSHAHNVTKRRFQINLQKVRVIVNGRVMRLRVSTKAIKSGLIEKPPVKLRQRKPKIWETASTAPVQEVTADDEPVGAFFSDTSVVSRVFKPKKPVVQEPDEMSEAMNAEEKMAEKSVVADNPEGNPKAVSNKITEDEEKPAEA